MKRENIPLWVGIAGLLFLQATCADSPTDPAWTGAPEPLARPEYLDVLVHNATLERVAVSVAFDGIDADELGVLREGTSKLFRVTSPALTGGGPAMFVAISTTGHGRYESKPLEVMAGWAVEVSMTSTGPEVSRARDLEGRTRY